MAPNADLAPAIASHRFGLSQISLASVGKDPRDWVLGQLRNPALLDTAGLPDSAQVTELMRDLRKNADPRSEERKRLREGNLLALRRRWQHQIESTTPVYERWVAFWANHFTVAATKGATQGMVWPFENEAIRPHATGRFATLLRASTVHPGMLLYLDNAQSIGPDSRAGQRRARGLNENLARELLELHTVGVHAGYTQNDVRELARLLTGWTTGRAEQSGAGFVPALHDPGSKTVMGRRYAQGPDALDAVLNDLARHPATATHLAEKLARHFVADDPPPALVQAVARRFRDTDGDLQQTADALFGHELAWAPHRPGKARRPEELLLSAHRLLQMPMGTPEREVAALTGMGQPMGRAPSPQGWPDRQDDWLGPDALLKRVEWAVAMGRSAGSLADARRLADLSWGPMLSGETRTQIARAESGAQALTLLLASPEFQRR
ncbi:DUF1800 family protein [Hydrogenophaga sp.]|uniref:DUF1800 domain-containing protein n=1 Tax=Hydrogenophaga sp. TaxID=1904254 RepID=UPI00271D841D|nr:DUF1800 domain-containing protein [Hydrogenophaga sp.]MDO9436758.1 DUF1800 domain-containing protein [Hydrogenophaga sp.]